MTPGSAARERTQRSQRRPEFAFDRVTNGFRGMPGLRDPYGGRDRQAVVTFVLSKDFSN
jgi:hypothetical protein